MSEAIQENKTQYMSTSLWGKKTKKGNPLFFCFFLQYLLNNSILSVGICLKPGEVYSFKGQGFLQLQQCNLNKQPTSGKTRLEVHAKGNTYTLCTLVANRLECQPLTQVFIAEDRATFKIKGAK
jgi:hypothetical protein